MYIKKGMILNMKKVILAVLICIILAGIAVIATIGVKADIIYSKNVQLNVYLNKTFEDSDIKQILQQVFQNERFIMKDVEIFKDEFTVLLKDNRTEEELNTKVQELVQKLNEKYELKLKEENIEIMHNPKVKLSSIILPYVVPIAISMIILFVYVGIRYKKLGTVKIIFTYLISIIALEMLLISIIAITRYQINQLIVPLALLLLIVEITIFGLINEKKLVNN